MSVQVFCPKCDRSCRIKEELLNRRVRCPGCQEIFRAEEVPLAEDDTVDEELPDFTPNVTSKQEDKREEPAAPKQVEKDESDWPLNDGDDDRAAEGDREEDERPSKHGRHERPAQRPNDRSVRKSEAAKAPAKKSEEPDEKKKGAGFIKPGAIENPFDEASQITPAVAPVDPSMFDFDDDGGEPPPPLPKKKEKDAERERDAGKKKEAREQDQTPFEGFAAVDLKKDDSERRPQKTKPHAPPKATAQTDSAAEMLGLEDLDQPDPKPVDAAKPKKTRKRKYFHVRQQAGFFGEVRLFRVFIQPDELVFIAAASGKDVADMEAALEAESLDKCEKKIRNKLLDLDELSPDELAENDRHSFRTSSEKVKAATVDAASFKLLGKSSAAKFHLEHKSKGVMNFDFPSDDDVDRALDYLPEIIEAVLKINVRFDKAKDCYVAR